MSEGRVESKMRREENMVGRERRGKANSREPVIAFVCALCGTEIVEDAF